MADWTSTMQQTFEYYIVDPGTWKDKKKIDTVISSKITRNLEAETLGSASITITESLGECYIRIYLVTIQNGIRERHPLGTYMVQTPSYSFDGKIKNITMDAYTPLIELKEKHPPLGYAITKDQNIMSRAALIMREQMRAPLVPTTKDATLHANFIANLDDTWITFIRDLIANADMRLDLDELGTVLFAPEQDLASLQPIWTFDTGNSSILYPSFDIQHDLYGIPNEVEVIYSNGTTSMSITAVNDDPNSPVSTVNRGRRITHRITNPSVVGKPSEAELKAYAARTLKSLSSIEYTVTYTHGYCPVRVGDCVRLNYEAAGLKNVKAKIISQTIDCVPGCPVTEKAIFTSELWNGGVV
jgi:hypothetical protein